ncbi:MAG: hypothetical protein L6R39_002676 [Caloplaca ligustica]|nr:MAG: hypothetical protein L6R39_002676 [Caloplaca ligustica]
MKIYAALALLLAAVNATPLDIVERDPAALEKRDTEIVYLANCKDVFQNPRKHDRNFFPEPIAFNLNKSPAVLPPQRGLQQQPSPEQRQQLHRFRQQLRDMGGRRAVLQVPHRRDLYFAYRLRGAEQGAV